MTVKAIRPWCAQARYPGLEPFVGGTITLPSDAKSHEIERALSEHFLTFIPPGFEIIKPMCGVLFFQPEDDDDR